MLDCVSFATSELHVRHTPGNLSKSTLHSHVQMPQLVAAAVEFAAAHLRDLLTSPSRDPEALLGLPRELLWAVALVRPLQKLQVAVHSAVVDYIINIRTIMSLGS
jgi:hypothetical protein